MQLWPGAVNFPDFFAQQTIEWWTSQIQGVYSQLPLDGLWIDMHEPSNFCTGDVCVLPGALQTRLWQCHLCSMLVCVSAEGQSQQSLTRTWLVPPCNAGTLSASPHPYTAPCLRAVQF